MNITWFCNFPPEWREPILQRMLPPYDHEITGEVSLLNILKQEPQKYRTVDLRYMIIPVSLGDDDDAAH